MYNLLINYYNNYYKYLYLYLLLKMQYIYNILYYNIKNNTVY